MLLKWDKSGLKLVIKPEILGIKVFKDLYVSDKTKDKEKLFTFFTYLYFLYFPTSEYVIMYDEEDFELRKASVMEDMGIEDDSYFSGPKFALCEDFYKRMVKNDMLEELRENKKTIKKLREFTRNYSLDDVGEVEKRPAVAAQLTNVIKGVDTLIVQTDKSYRELIKNIDEDDLIASNITKSLSAGDRMGMDMDFSEFLEK